MPDDGELGGACYPNGTCNVTLLCESGVCVSGHRDAGMSDGSTGDGSGFNCADDSALEPNDTIGTAFQTPVASQMSSLTLAGLAICPIGDKDLFTVSIVIANTGLTATLDYEATTGLQASILNSGGVAIANASATGPKQIRAAVPNLPVGTYYVQVQASAQNNYMLRLAVE